MNSLKRIILFISIILPLSNCKDGTKWDQSLDDNSSSLIRHDSEDNSKIIARGIKLIVYEVDYKGVGSPGKLEKKATNIWEFTGPDIKKLISNLRGAFDSKGISAHNFVPLYQVMLIDSNETIIGHWRVRSSPDSPNEYAIIFPTGGMNHFPGFGKLGENYPFPKK